MLDILESSENGYNDYFNIQNLSFNHPLTDSELEEFRSLIFSLNNLNQIYFKGTIDTNSIETIKDLLSISGFIDDSCVEKCIVATFSEEELNAILNSRYEHPDTWKVCYDVEDNNYMLADIPKCRTFFSYIEKIKSQIEKENLSDFEKVLKVYDIVKLIEYNNNSSDLLPDIVVNQEATSLGFNRLFTYILKSLGFKCFIGKEKLNNQKYTFVSMVNIHDEKYNIDGLYLFDSSMDSLSKEIYKNDDVRMINYNYFGLRLKDINNSTHGDYLTGALGILSIEDYDLSFSRYLNNKNNSTKKEFLSLNDIFGLSYEDLYEQIKKSPAITFETIETAINNVYGNSDNKENYNNLLRENYFSRKEELFNPTVDEMLEVMLK